MYKRNNPESMSEFVKSYLQNIPGFSNEFDENKYCCNGCFYASEKYMKDNFIADSVDYIQDQIESIQHTFTKHPTINNPGLNNSVLLCCRAFLYLISPFYLVMSMKHFCNMQLLKIRMI